MCGASSMMLHRCVYSPGAYIRELVAMQQDDMRIFELKSDGQLTRDLVDEVGDEYSISERRKDKMFGVGQLRYNSGNSILDEFYDRHNQTIKTHFDWTKKGAVIRIRTMSNIYAIGLEDKGFKKILLTKNPDYIYAMPFFPFWILLKIGTPIKLAKWFRLRGDKIYRGKCEVRIEHNGNVMTFDLTGDLWADCLKTFIIERIKDRLIIEDKRTWLTDNGFRVNSGTATTKVYKPLPGSL